MQKASQDQSAIFYQENHIIKGSERIFGSHPLVPIFSQPFNFLRIIEQAPVSTSYNSIKVKYQSLRMEIKQQVQKVCPFKYNNYCINQKKVLRQDIIDQTIVVQSITNTFFFYENYFVIMESEHISKIASTLSKHYNGTRNLNFFGLFGLFHGFT